MGRLGCAQGFGASPPYCGSIRDLQQQLADAGFYTSEVDGKWGTKTQNAVVAFAQSKGIKVSGGINQAFCDALAAETAASEPQAPEPSGAGVPQPSAPRSEPTAVAESGGSGTLAWWSRQQTGTKVAVVGGGVAVLAIIGLLAFGGRKRPQATMVKNRRRRARGARGGR